MDELFLSSKDTATHRVCGCCGELKPVEDFYKDGKDSHGIIRYRRDCKWCYKTARVKEEARKHASKTRRR